MSELKRYDVQVEVAFPHGVCWSASRLHSVDGEHVDAEEALHEIATLKARIVELEAALRDVEVSGRAAENVELIGAKARIAELEHQLEVQSMLARANQRDLSAEQSAGRDLFVRLRELEAELKSAKFSRDWSQRRLALLQQWQSRMRDPERKIVCDILANGSTLPDPDGKRYGVSDDGGELIARQADLLRGVVDAIRGPHPDPLTRWSVHDAPELAAALVARCAALEAEVVDLYKIAMRCLREEPSETTYLAASGHVANAISEISARRAVIEWERDELRTALRDLVEQVETLDDYGHQELQMPLRVTCPTCEAQPDEPIGLCPYHAAKALLGGDGG